MTDTPRTSESTGLPYAGLRCPHCEYDLTGAPEPRCPECGEAFDPVKLQVATAWWKRQPPWWVTWLAVLLAVYLPNTWVFWIDYPWGGGYRMHWVMMFPLLPALLLMAWGIQVIGVGNNLDGTIGYVLMGIVSAALIAVGVYEGRCTRFSLLVVSLTIFALQVFNAMGCYALFRM